MVGRLVRRAARGRTGDKSGTAIRCPHRSGSSACVGATPAVRPSQRGGCLWPDARRRAEDFRPLEVQKPASKLIAEIHADSFQARFAAAHLVAQVRPCLRAVRRTRWVGHDSDLVREHAKLYRRSLDGTPDLREGKM